MPPTEQDTEIHILGSGATAYPWYVMQTRTDKVDYAADKAVLDGWSVQMTMFDGDHGDCNHLIVVTVNHDRLMSAMRDIAAGRASGFSTECESECAQFLLDPELADFDADTADQVLQVLAYGAVVYS